MTWEDRLLLEEIEEAVGYKVSLVVIWELSLLLEWV